MVRASLRNLLLGGPRRPRQALPEPGELLLAGVPRDPCEPAPARVEHLPGAAQPLQHVELPGAGEVDQPFEGRVGLHERRPYAVLHLRGLLHREGQLRPQAPGPLKAVVLPRHRQQRLRHAGRGGRDHLGVLGVVLGDPGEELARLLLPLARDVGDVAPGGQGAPHHDRADVAALVDDHQARPRLAVGGLEGPRDEGVDGGLVVVDLEGEDPAPRAGPGVGRMEALADVEADEELVAGVLGPCLEAGLRGHEHGGILPSVSANAPGRDARPATPTLPAAAGLEASPGMFPSVVLGGHAARAGNTPRAFGRGRAKGPCAGGRSGRPKGCPNIHLFVKK